MRKKRESSLVSGSVSYQQGWQHFRLWQHRDGRRKITRWVYYDSNGNKVYNEWKKGADGQWRYLNGEGCMATNAWAGL